MGTSIKHLALFSVMLSLASFVCAPFNLATFGKTRTGEVFSSSALCADSSAKSNGRFEAFLGHEAPVTNKHIDLINSAFFDDDLVELVIGLNKAPDVYANIAGVVNKLNGRIVSTISAGCEVVAAVV